ncbi:MAG TPA: CBS domain-containing protein [Anaerolineaceae bacterium]
MDTVRHILQIKGNDVWATTPRTTVYDALRVMADKNCGALLVMEGEKVVGIFSERDYARKVILQGRSSKETLVSEIMTSKLHTIHPDQTVEEAMEIMTNKRVRHLPVMEGDHLVGMISIGDVLREIIYVQLSRIHDMEDKILGKS